MNHDINVTHCSGDPRHRIIIIIVVNINRADIDIDINWMSRLSRRGRGINNNISPRRAGLNTLLLLLLLLTPVCKSVKLYIK